MTNQNIPVVNLRKFTEGNPEERTHFVRELGAAFHEVGFVGVVAAMDLTCLDNCVDEDHPLNYGPITTGAYLDEISKEIGLKK